MSEPMTDERFREVETCILYSEDPTFECNPSWDEVAQIIRRLREVERNLRETSKIALTIVEEGRDRLWEENEFNLKELFLLRAEYHQQVKLILRMKAVVDAARELGKNSGSILAMLKLNDAVCHLDEADAKTTP